MIIPILMGVGGYAAYKHHKRTSVGMTPERKAVFEATLKDQSLTPVQIETVAKGFDTAGLKAESAELRKRIAILTAPPETIAARTAAFKKAISSTDKEAVQKVAAAFHAVGHYKAAEQLRSYAKGLFSHQSPTPVATLPVK